MKSNLRIVVFLRLAVDEGEEALRREQTRVQELQQQLEQERAVSLHKDRDAEERRGVRLGQGSKFNTPKIYFS